MTHYKHGNDKQGEFVAVIPDEQITEGSFEATVCLIVDHVLDLSAFETNKTVIFRKTSQNIKLESAHGQQIQSIYKGRVVESPFLTKFSQNAKLQA